MLAEYNIYVLGKIGKLVYHVIGNIAKIKKIINAKKTSDNVAEIGKLVRVGNLGRRYQWLVFSFFKMSKLCRFGKTAN